MSGPIRDATQAYQQMEATLLRQMLQSSGAFKPSAMAGGQIRADLFIETLADAVAKSGGIGIARMLEGSLPDASDPSPLLPPSSPPPSPSLSSSPSSPSDPTSAVVTSPFGLRHDPIDGTTKYHTGVDLRAAEGSPIRVAADGVVRSAGPRGGYGNAVEIDHGGGVTTLYAHAAELLVKPGDPVAEGQAIARVGQTGRTTGPHLHFEVRVDDRPVDPGRHVGFSSRALNAYRERAEETVAGYPPSSRSGAVP
jgi:murein DD-endopeptidase MepM/ murein hydrolase activator NlpD